ncbi:endolytic transglycosylase MltG [Hansschlegelia beijingensis]|uniref:Endolytic murein transglycosylase n=1 Tax=Hansschlegelia beijingensis TaxID=1133344 RepID=A0A7W6GI39_9HYPH|nr:UPF0755 protein [Hansschlegelia beijingensis]
MSSEGAPPDPKGSIGGASGGAGAPPPRPRLVSSNPSPQPAGGDAAAPASDGVERPAVSPAAGKRRRRRRDSALVGYLSGLFTFLSLLALCAGGALYYGKSLFERPGPLAAETTVMIARNQGVADIADSLQRAGVIEHPRVFEIGVRAYGVHDRLRFGEYAFPARVSMHEAMDILASGKSIEHPITIPEGLTSLQIVERLRDHPLLTGEIKEIPEEGTLLPETYNFVRGTSREQVIARMQQHQKEAVAQIWKDRKPIPGVKTPQDLIILASLVEKETGIPEERPRVAAVFANRLRKGMRLQSDPTIVYGLVGGRGTLGRSLNRTDIRSKTPYNTYVVSGLPAGPIANPGRDALKAAAQPPETRDLYFVADGTGGHAFAPTLVEHNRNVAKWRKLERASGAPADRLTPDDAAAEAPEAGGAVDPDETGAAASSSTPPSKNEPRKPRRP